MRKTLKNLQNLYLGLLPEFAEQFSIINFTDDFRSLLIKVKHDLYLSR